MQKRRRGQAATEMILLIGLIVLALICALFWYRDSVIRFTDRVADWIQGDPPTPRKSVAPPSRSVTPPADTLPPAPPTPADPPAGDYSGTWCVTAEPDPEKRVSNYRLEPAGDGTYKVWLVTKDGTEHDASSSLVPDGPDRFTLRTARGDVRFAARPDGSYSDGGTWKMWRC